MTHLKIFETNSPVNAGGEHKIHITSVALTDVGLVRQVNEDTVAVVTPEREDLLLSHGVLGVIADGMGGAIGGSRASRTAVDVVTQCYVEDSGHPPQALQKALLAANAAIFKLAQREPDLEGMGTTCVALALTPEQAWVAWVGDSRAYLIRNRQLFQLTEDHSWVSDLVREGVLTAEQAAYHQDRHILTKALGTKREIEISVWEQPIAVRAGDRFLLCSDGLYDLLTEDEILAGATAASVKEASAALIQKANDSGGYDNISSVILEVSSSSQLLTHSDGKGIFPEGTSKP
jgi:PPM family protein phosphatase